MLGVPEDPLAIGTALPASADLNSYTTPGNYTADSTVIASITHAPTTTVEYKLTVEQISDEVIKQTVTTTEAPANVYQRTGDSSSTDWVFGDWVKEIKNTDYASTTTGGVIKVETYSGHDVHNGVLRIYRAQEGDIKAGTQGYKPITPSLQQNSVFYGLTKAAGVDMKDSSNPVGTYTDEAKSAIKNMIGVEDLDVQINGTSIVENGVANIPIAGQGVYGAVKISSNTTGTGLTIDSFGSLAVSPATVALIKDGTNSVKPITPNYQHQSAFYGLAKAAGDTTQSASDNLVGDYTAEAKEAIQEMLDVPSTADKADVITTTAAGSLVTITDGADNMPVKSCVVNIEPIQDLYGYDSPWLAGGGKNKFTNVGETLDTYLKSDGTVSTATGWNISDYISVVPSTTYTFTPNSTSGVSAYSCFYDDNKNVISSVQSGQQTFTTPENCKFMRFSYRNTSTNIQLELGSEATSYAPYENICPINGRTGLSVVRAGKNLYDAETYPLTSGWVHGGEGDIGSDRTYYCIQDYIPCVGLRGKTITLNHRPGGTNPGFAFYNNEKVFISGEKNNSRTADEPMTATVPNNACYYRFTVSANYLDEIQIELGSEATEYEPYRGVTASVNWTTEAGTVYGGTINLISGKLIVDSAYLEPDASRVTHQSEWVDSRYGISTPVYPLDHAMTEDPKGLYCNRLPSVRRRAIVDGSVGISYDVTVRRLFIGLPDITTLEEAQEWVTNNPLQIVYKLAEPIEYQLSAQEIRTLLGINNFWSDGDNIELEYSADTKSYVDKSTIDDVQANGTSVVSNGIANIPKAVPGKYGVVKASSDYGVGCDSSWDTLRISSAALSYIKTGEQAYKPIVPGNQHQSVFYGLAKLAGSDMKDSSNAVGTYTDAAKSAIKTMFGVPTDSYDLNLGADIPANADLNAYTTSGTYNADTTVISGIVNAPTTTETYKLVVESIDDDLIRQTAISKSHVYQRTGDVSTSSWVFTDWVQNITSTDYATYESGGAVRVGGDGLAIMYGKLYVQRATDAEVKACGNGNKPIVPLTQNAATFYGLAKAAGDTTQSASDNAVGTYTDEAKSAIRTMLGTVGDVQVNGTSIVSNGVAEIPIVQPNGTTYGLVRPLSGLGTAITSSGYLAIAKASNNAVKVGASENQPIVPINQHIATFYGLAKAAGADMASSNNAVGTYTQEAKTAIQTMLGVTVPEAVGSCVEYISDSSVTIVGEPNTRYVCGEVTSIDITPPAVGTIDVTFTSGSTIAILTLPSTVKMPEWWGGVETGYTYELVITDGVYTGVMAWPQ